MSDNEIIKALECCCDDKQTCKECPYVGNGCICGNENSLHKDALDLINRQKAESERLKADFETLEAKYRYVDSQIPMFEAEARKEFAERLCEGRVSNDPVVIAVKVELAEMESERG